MKARISIVTGVIALTLILLAFTLPMAPLAAHILTHIIDHWPAAWPAASINTDTLGAIMIKYDHIVHFILFLALTLLFIFPIRRSDEAYKLGLRRAYLLFTLGALTEIMQIFIPFRSAAIDDLLSNFFGVIAGVIVISASHYIIHYRSGAAGRDKAIIKKSTC